jgi:hypothetical protein
LLQMVGLLQVSELMVQVFELMVQVLQLLQVM